MDWNWYLFSFEGRINRAKFWLSLPILLGWMFLVALIMWLIMITALMTTIGSHDHEAVVVSLGFDELFTLLGRASHRSLSSRDIVSLVGNLFGMGGVMWICLATAVKRLHDRDKSGWWIVPFFVLPGLSDNIPDWLRESSFSFPLGLALFILCIWGFIELGFLRGTDRTNLFGPDPLLAKDEDTRLRRSGLGSHAAAWDQRYEMELAPHRASPMSSMHVKRGA
jgi:uncharacterized membrane protein YhaH (DUF805 family)